MNNDYLSHHGVKGQKWGVRRYQNPDGSLTKAGEKRYSQLDNQAKPYDSEYQKHMNNYKSSKAMYEDIVKNGKNSKYAKEIFEEEIENPDEEMTFDGTSAKDLRIAAKRRMEYYGKSAKNAQNLAESIRSTPLNQKSYAEIAKKKEAISKGITATSAAGNIALNVFLAKKGVIGKGRAITGSLLGTLFVSSVTRAVTATNPYMEYEKKEGKKNE